MKTKKKLENHYQRIFPCVRCTRLMNSRRNIMCIGCQRDTIIQNTKFWVERSK